MSDLKIGTTLGGQTIWSGANLPLLPDGNSVYYKSFLVYSENDKPSKADVGLGSVQNYPIASLSEAESGTINTAYMTPLRTKQAVDIHGLRTDNPHGVTKTQVELGNVQNYGLSSTSEAQTGAVNNKYMTPLRNQEHFVSKTTTFTRDFLTKSTALAARSKLEVLRAGTAGGEVRTNTQLDSRYALQSSQIVAGDGINGGGDLSTSRTLSVDSSVVRTNVAQTITSDTILRDSTYLQKYFHFNDYDDGTKVSGIRGYVRDGVLTLRGNSGESVSAGISIDGSIAAGGFSGDGGALNNLQASSLSGTISYTNLQFGSTDVSNWGTAYSRSLTNISGSGNGTLTLTRQDGSTYTTNLSHNHSASNITSGTLSSARLPTITTSMVNFANQSLNTGSSPTFSNLTINLSSGERFEFVGSHPTLKAESTGGWAREYRIEGTGTANGTFGAFGGGSSVNYVYIAQSDSSVSTYSSSNALRIYSTYPAWGNNRLYHEGHKPTLGELGAAPSSHNHNASNITSGTLSSARLPTITTSMVNFANQYLNTGSRPTFSGATLNGNVNIGSNPFILHSSGTNSVRIGSGIDGNAALSLQTTEGSTLRSRIIMRGSSSDNIEFYGNGYSYGDFNSSRIYFTRQVRASSFRINSDKELKDDITPLTNNSGLRLKSWIWKEQEGVKRDYINDTGVIAQDVEEVFPTCVSKDEDTGYLSVDYGKLGVHHSIKLAEKVEQLEKRLEDFESKSIWSLLIFKMKRLLWP